MPLDPSFWLEPETPKPTKPELLTEVEMNQRAEALARGLLHDINQPGPYRIRTAGIIPFFETSYVRTPAYGVAEPKIELTEAEILHAKAIDFAELHELLQSLPVPEGSKPVRQE